MPPTRFEASHIKNKHKREEVQQKIRKAKAQAKLQRRLATAKAESNDPEAKRVSVLRVRYLGEMVLTQEHRNGWPKMFLELWTICESLIPR